MDPKNLNTDDYMLFDYLHNNMITVHNVIHQHLTSSAASLFFTPPKSAGLLSYVMSRNMLHRPHKFLSNSNSPFFDPKNP